MYVHVCRATAPRARGDEEFFITPYQCIHIYIYLYMSMYVFLIYLYISKYVSG